MKKTLFMVIGLLTLGLASCEKDAVKGEGSITTENRTGDAFTDVEVEGNPKIFILYGPVIKIAVSGYNNLVPLFETRVSNNTLKCGYKSGSNIKKNNIEVHITMPVLTRLYTNGSVDTQITGNFPYTPAMNFKVNGSGSTVIESGSTGSLNIESSGSGNYNLLGLQAQQATIKMAGSGEIKTAVSNKLTAKIDGSGKVYYQGSPTVELDVNGSGKVAKL